jgi:acetyltransferase-like isoleucine patch superfamily enzyme
MKTFLFYLRYYLNNHWISHIPFHFIRIWWYRAIMKMKMSSSCNIQLGVTFYGDAINKISIGEHSVIHPRCVFNASAPIILGDRVHLAHAVEFYTTDHDPEAKDFGGRVQPINLEDDVYVGSRATILRGVTLGKGCVVAAGSVVTKSVEPYTVVGGVPARVLKKRSDHVKNTCVGKPPLFC